MSVAIDRFSDIRYFYRQASLICFGRSEINATFFSARYGRVCINCRRIIACRLTAITSTFNRLFPTFPIIFIRAIFSEISERFIS